MIVSHSENLAKAVVELAAMMASDAPLAAAGGLEDGSFGTSFERIKAAIESVYSDDGVLVLMDMGSAVMTTEMVIESMPGKKIKMADCPIVEGAVMGAVNSSAGLSLEEIVERLAETREESKL